MKARWLVLGFIFWSAQANPLDLNSYCLGACQGRYQSGYYAGSGRCGCVDYVPINLAQRYILPRRAKDTQDIKPPAVYYGSDEMHEAPPE
jgi:hypothetical protein